jgi:hypothetical protein
MARLYGRAGRLTAKNGGFWPGQYLPQYAIAFQQGRAAGVMCSYNEVNGVPMCANQVTFTV